MKERFLIRLFVFAGLSGIGSAFVCAFTGLAFSHWPVLAIWLLCAIYSFRLLGSAAGGAVLGIFGLSTKRIGTVLRTGRHSPAISTI